MFQNLPTALNAGIFVAAAVVVWLAGTRVSRYADAIQKRTKVGEAVLGMLLLGLITALPELGVTVTASYAGNPNLAVNNLLGGMALNVAILASADAAIRREALTSAVASVLPLLQAVMLVLMLAIVAGATIVGDRPILGIGVWTWLLLTVYVLAVTIVRRTRGHEAWRPEGMQGSSNGSPGGGQGQVDDDEDAGREQGNEGGALGPLVRGTAVGAGVILTAGYALAQTGDVLAERTGLGQSFFGAVFLALSTSLPEISIVFSSVRLANYAMAVADIFGANLFGLALLFLVDAVHQGEPVLGHAGPFATFAAILGIAVTALFIAGLLERRHFMILRMGSDSLVVIGTYVAGVAVLYTLK